VHSFPTGRAPALPWWNEECLYVPALFDFGVKVAFFSSFPVSFGKIKKNEGRDGSKWTYSTPEINLWYYPISNDDDLRVKFPAQ